MTDTVNIDARLLLPVAEITATVEEVDGHCEIVPERAYQARWRTALGRVKGRRVDVIVLKHRLRRSTKANAFLWASIYPELLQELRVMAEKVGEKCPFANVDELHEVMKYLILGTEVVEFAGARLERPSTTTTLSLEAFSAYIAGIRKLAFTRWQIILSEPD